jgi:hypothetical protein
MEIRNIAAGVSGKQAVRRLACAAVCSPGGEGSIVDP